MKPSGTGANPLEQSEHYSTLARAIRGKVQQVKTPDVKDELTSLAECYERLASWSAALGATVLAPPPSATSITTPEITLSINPLSTPELTAGETYDSWLCQACHDVLALAPRAPHADPLDLPDAIIRLRCPHCGAQRHYTVHERRVRKYPWHERAADAESLAAP